MTRTALKQRIREIWHKLEHVDARPDQLWDVLQKSWDVYAAMLVGSIIRYPRYVAHLLGRQTAR